MDLRHSGYEETQRRADLFSYIVDLVRTQGDEPEGLYEGAPDRAPELLPKIHIIGQTVICNGARLDLSRRPLSLALFRAFSETPSMQLTRPEVVAKIYGVSSGEGISERYLESLYGNVVKLISRTRLLAAGFLARGSSQGIEWFAYDGERRVWALYRLKSEYLARHDA